MAYLIIEHNLQYLFYKVNYLLFNFQGVLPQTCMKNQWLIEKHQNYKPKKKHFKATQISFSYFVCLTVSTMKVKRCAWKLHLSIASWAFCLNVFVPILDFTINFA